MRPPMFRLFKTLVLSLASSLIFLGAVQAESFLVNWGGDYLGQEASGLKLNLGPETLITDATPSTIGVGFGYDEAMPKSPEIARYDSQKPSAVFYGAFQVMNPATLQNDNPAALLRSYASLKALGGKNAIGFGSAPPKGGTGTEITGLVFWQKKDFLSGANAGAKIAFSRISGMSLNSTSLNVKEGGGSIRFAIQNGGKWYLSDGESKKAGPFSISESNWGEWPGLGAAFPLPEVPTDFPVSSAQLDDITAVGVFFQASSTKDDVNAVFNFNSFQVEYQP